MELKQITQHSRRKTGAITKHGNSLAVELLSSQTALLEHLGERAGSPNCKPLSERRAVERTARVPIGCFSSSKGSWESFPRPGNLQVKEIGTSEVPRVRSQGCEAPLCF